jgi:hypothetical protein
VVKGAQTAHPCGQIPKLCCRAIRALDIFRVKKSSFFGTCGGAQATATRQRGMKWGVAMTGPASPSCPRLLPFFASVMTAKRVKAGLPGVIGILAVA